MRSLGMIAIVTLVGVCAFLSAAAEGSPFHNNLAFRSPLAEFPIHGHDASLESSKHMKRNSDGWWDVEQNSQISKNVPVFQFGVASGDPHCDSVILWTRAAPRLACILPNEVYTNNTCDCAPTYSRNAVGLCVGGKDGLVRNITEDLGPVLVEWQVSKTKNFSHIVKKGRVATSSKISYSVKVEADCLEPDTVYYYRFIGGFNASITSPVGITRTLPDANSNVTRPWKLAVYSCSNLPQGYFNAYGIPARQGSVDLVVHVGDYIYEYANGGYGNGTSTGRVPLPADRDIVELEDCNYQTGIRSSVADNSWKDGAANHNATVQGPYSVRKMNAFKAAFEWMPIRQLEVFGKIWRTFAIGKLFDLVMVDTRHWGRDVTDMYYNTAYVKNISTWDNRTILGFDQERWLKDNIVASKNRGAKWRVIGNQVQFDVLNFSSIPTLGLDFNYDSWDGYIASRKRLLNHVQSNKNWVHDIPDVTGKYNSTTGDGALGAEFVGTAVSSPSPFKSVGQAATAQIIKALVGANSGLQWAEAWERGYFVLTVSNEAVTADYFAVSIANRTDTQNLTASFQVKDGANRLTRGFTNSTLGSQKLL
ncbi:hypothetical protein HDU93_009404 [Gonapodya sp. JEL0774]|nr:hypothetical protein HDU93_009404 [Gonapodya sp. JEL0774]